jgi:acyl-CoA reductase-like NAD-dependent aldehyde dehydrogenase
VNPAIVAGKQDAWAKLPPAQRDELLQAFREEMPERWRKRLEAYFLSIAAEEAKETEK